MQTEEYTGSEEFTLGYRHGFNDLRGFGDGVIETAIEGMGSGFSDEFVRGLRAGVEHGRERLSSERIAEPKTSYVIDHEAEEPMTQKEKDRGEELRQWEEDYELWQLRRHERDGELEYS